MKAIVIAFFALILCACAGSGAIKWDKARQIKVGMTEKEVATLMGQPYQAQSVDSKLGSYRWVWVNVNMLTGGGADKMTAIFSKEGVVIEVPVIPDSWGK